ncbi:MAG TPA: hypothetical protein VMA95_04265 [Streptosporangiaceae bacterium]|nr:hypothetical protein [Streptosporangiaceae bacterium]
MAEHGSRIEQAVAEDLLVRQGASVACSTAEADGDIAWRVPG